MSQQGNFIEIWFEERAKIICLRIQRKNKLTGHMKISDAGLFISTSKPIPTLLILSSKYILYEACIFSDNIYPRCLLWSRKRGDFAIFTIQKHGTQ